MNDRRFTDDATLYHSTPTTSSTGVVKSGWDAGTAIKCLMFPGGGNARRMEAGVLVEYDAKMLVAADLDIRPGQHGEHQDYLVWESKCYLVDRVENAGGRGRFQIVLLTGIPEVPA